VQQAKWIDMVMVAVNYKGKLAMDGASEIVKDNVDKLWMNRERRSWTLVTQMVAKRPTGTVPGRLRSVFAAPAP